MLSPSQSVAVRADLKPTLPLAGPVVVATNPKVPGLPVRPVRVRLVVQVRTRRRRSDAGGGGGGKSGVGADAASNTGGNGGAGAEWPASSGNYYAGGGGGATRPVSAGTLVGVRAVAGCGAMDFIGVTAARPVQPTRAAAVVVGRSPAWTAARWLRCRRHQVCDAVMDRRSFHHRRYRRSGRDRAVGCVPANAEDRVSTPLRFRHRHVHGTIVEPDGTINNLSGYHGVVDAPAARR